MRCMCDIHAHTAVLNFWLNSSCTLYTAAVVAPGQQPEFGAAAAAGDYQIVLL